MLHNSSPSTRFRNIWLSKGTFVKGEVYDFIHRQILALILKQKTQLAIFANARTSSQSAYAHASNQQPAY
jgi:hypothetical protein